ncbi:MAG TPA: hypothetical protein VK453_25405 [Micromonosporaceae bacterium]|nr:hypothetical protein [Micromonosporaceae bacterium]
MNLLDELPGESAYKTAVTDALADDELAKLSADARSGRGRWSHTAMLQAAQIDALQQVAYILNRANGGDMKPPKPWPRPGVSTSKPKRSADSAAKAALRAIALEHARLHGYDVT